MGSITDLGHFGKGNQNEMESVKTIFFGDFLTAGLVWKINRYPRGLSFFLLTIKPEN